MLARYGSLMVTQIPCLTDNYAFLIHDEVGGTTAAVDTPDADVIAAALDERGWGLDFILNTHWHPDHTGGNERLKARYGATVVGPAGEGDRIPVRDRAVGAGDRVEVGGSVARVLETPGHTTGHICYLFDAEKLGFVGDTLFSLGCGRLFEGTPSQMWESLRAVRALGDEWTLYCAHEYTLANARFAASLGEENTALADRMAQIVMLREADKPTVPMDLGLERRTNPFLRADDPSLAVAVGMEGARPDTVFAEIRARKDAFRG